MLFYKLYVGVEAVIERFLDDEFDFDVLLLLFVLDVANKSIEVLKHFLVPRFDEHHDLAIGFASEFASTRDFSFETRRFIGFNNLLLKTILDIFT
jgi:hypothetical protein